MPLVVAALAYFADLLTLGVIAQTRYAYDQVAGGLAWFVNAYQEIARWRANIERLTSFSDALDDTERAFASGGIRVEAGDPATLRLRDLRVEAPRGQLLLDGANATARAGQRIALSGPQGSGRTVLMRALAGIWPFGAGRIEAPPRDNMLFLAQKPYLPIGTLRAALSYPSAPGTFPDDRIAEALGVFGIAKLAARLDDEEPWEQQLSLHEQQRVALARVLLHEPAWILLDEATSDLDEATESKAYAVLDERLPQSTLVAVAERAGVLPYLPQRWTLEPGADGRVALVTT